MKSSIGLAQLERIEEIHKNRREYENNYKNLLPPNKFLFQNNIKNRTRITWLVSVLLNDDIDRDNYIQRLKDKGIDARTFFYPLSDMDIYKDFCQNETPIAHKLSKIGLNLPTYENLINIKDIEIILKDFVHV